MEEETVLQEETVVYKLVVSDKRIKEMAMKAIWEESGITFVEVSNMGTLKMTGKFSKYEMVMKLSKIDKSADIVSSELHNPISTSLLPNFLNFSGKQEIVVFKFKILDESIKQVAMAIIWEFSGVSSVKVKREEGQLEVKGIFEKYETARKLQAEIDESVSIINIRPDVEVEKEVKLAPNNGGFHRAASTSKLPIPTLPTIEDAKKFYVAGYEAINKFMPKNNNKQWQPLEKKILRGKAFGEQQEEDAQARERHKFFKEQQAREKAAEKQRIEKEKAEELEREKAAEKKQRIEKEKAAEKQRIEKAKAERFERQRKAEEKQRTEKKKAERIERHKAAEKRRIEKEKTAEKQRQDASSSKWLSDTDTDKVMKLSL